MELTGAALGLGPVSLSRLQSQPSTSQFSQCGREISVQARRNLTLQEGKKLLLPRWKGSLGSSTVPLCELLCRLPADPNPSCWDVPLSPHCCLSLLLSPAA